MLEWVKDNKEGEKTKETRKAGFVDDKLVYMEFRADVNVSARDPTKEKEPFYDKFEDWMQDWLKSAPDQLKSTFQEANFAWGWMPTEKAFVTSALSGIFIAMSFAFMILLVSTRNFIQSVLSITCVIIIVTSVVAIMELKGWQLGVSESISVVILIGFSVDYVIHLAADYTHCAFQSRHDKM